ncbi:hypothetical protein BP6252_11284 [Coleophoma cylindrospora]|uniref:Uncharacterized protein n=1 Tax=Coleophoma cylindrospora TaxID=1849047 RepID=A0A3D8QPK8_9HELO|nr:hypothetical protein BP6252_11284 [Coleophoma cylindrospora]
MPLQLCPVELQDFDELASHATTYPPGEDLTGLPTPICCIVTTKEEAAARLAFHFNKQRTRFVGDPTVRYMKVIDTDNPNPIISIARWHFYPNGYDFEAEIPWEMHIPTPELQPSIPQDFNIPAHNHFLRSRDGARTSWVPANAPC